jgi:hypothetical protein
MLYSRFEIAFVFIFLLLIALDLLSYFVNAELSSCISYDSSKREITSVGLQISQKLITS